MPDESTEQRKTSLLTPTLLVQLGMILFTSAMAVGVITTKIGHVSDKVQVQGVDLAELRKAVDPRVLELQFKNLDKDMAAIREQNQSLQRKIDLQSFEIQALKTSLSSAGIVIRYPRE